MKCGTIVVCLPLDIHSCNLPYIKWLPEMDERTPYTLREIEEDSVAFEEGVIGHRRGKEMSFPIEYVREILPAEDISEQIQEIIENYQVLVH